MLKNLLYLNLSLSISFNSFREIEKEDKPTSKNHWNPLKYIVYVIWIK